MCISQSHISAILVRGSFHNIYSKSERDGEFTARFHRDTIGTKPGEEIRNPTGMQQYHQQEIIKTELKSQTGTRGEKTKVQGLVFMAQLADLNLLSVTILAKLPQSNTCPITMVLIVGTDLVVVTDCVKQITNLLNL